MHLQLLGHYSTAYVQNSRILLRVQFLPKILNFHVCFLNSYLTTHFGGTQF